MAAWQRQRRGNGKGNPKSPMDGGEIPDKWRLQLGTFYYGDN